MTTRSRPKDHGRRVFISYAREDLQHALRLYGNLRQRGEQPWLDIKSLLGGEDWQLAVAQAIRRADYFVPLLSARSVSKQGYVQKEIREALAVLDEQPGGRVYIIPLRLDECTPIHNRLSGLNWLDAFPHAHDWKSAVDKMIETFDVFSPDIKPILMRKRSPSATPQRTISTHADVASRLSEIIQKALAKVMSELNETDSANMKLALEDFHIRTN